QHITIGGTRSFQKLYLIGDNQITQATMIIAVGILRMGRVQIWLTPNALHVYEKHRSHAGFVGAIAPEEVFSILHFDRCHYPILLIRRTENLFGYVEPLKRLL